VPIETNGASPLDAK